MDNTYLEILKEWEDRVADPAVYEHLDALFPSYAFRRIQAGGPKDHWASRFKLDLSLPRIKNAEKTVVYRSEMRFREQGNWSESQRVMDKYMRDEGLQSIYEAYQAVSLRLGLDMPRPDSREVAEAIGRTERLSSLLDTLLDYFCWNLENNRSAKTASVRQYLKRNRGISAEQSSLLCLGFVPDWSKVIRYVTIDKGFRLEELDEVCGVRNADGYTAVGKTHVLAIPYECGGVLKGFLFRRIDDGREGPKYIANAGLDRKSVFFNISADHDPKDIVVVEGEMDALKATAEGIANVVAVGGSEIAGERRRQIEDAFRRGVQSITLCFDLDPVSGEETTPNYESLHEHVMKSVRTIKDVNPSFENIRVALFPEVSDPDEFIRNRGADAFKTLIGAAVPYWQYDYQYHVSGI